MVEEVPHIRTQTPKCGDEPGHVEAMPAVTVNRGATAERAGADRKTHAGWFHRSSPGKVQWIPANGGDLRTRPEPTRNQVNLMTAGAPMTRTYAVGEVKGRRPGGLDDFLGVTSFTVVEGDLTVLVFGAGEQSADGVRFRQQDLDRHGKEIRTWLITTAPDGIIAHPGTSV